MSQPVILLINGPNLNMLGVRAPHHYGTTSLEELTAHLDTLASELEVELRHFQSNHEGDIVDAIHAARQYAAFIVINAGAYTHTSIAIRDALEAVSIPFIEVHISNVYRRETFRQHSYLSSLALGVIAGLGVEGYEYALRKASSLLYTPSPGSPAP